MRFVVAAVIALSSSRLAAAENGAGAASPPAAPEATSPADRPATRQLETKGKPWTGDFDGILERRVIRALVPYSRSLYFNDRGRQGGISAEHVRGFEKWLNGGTAPSSKPRSSRT